MATAIDTLKTYFENGKKPREQEFAELIDAFIHRDDDLQIFAGEFAEIAEAQQGAVTDKYMAPFLTRIAIIALTRLADISDLEAEVDAKDNAVKTELRDGIAANQNTLKKLRDALIALLNNHSGLTNNPHSVTKSQVGLGNLPNAKSDAVTLNSSTTLATSKVVKTLNNSKEPVFTKNSGFNKTFGVGSNNVPRGNHQNNALHYFGSQKAITISSGITVTGSLTATNELRTTQVFELKPFANNSFKAFFGRFSGDDYAFIRVDKSDGTANYNALFQFVDDGDIYFSSIANRIRERVSGTVIGSTSDNRLKRNVKTLADGKIDLIKQLNPISHLFHNKEDEGKTTPDKLGFIAQEMEVIIPQIVDTSKQGFKSIDYAKLTVVLTKAMQEQQSEIDNLKVEIEAIKQQINI